MWSASNIVSAAVLAFAVLVGFGVAGLEIHIWKHHPEGIVSVHGHRTRPTLIGAALWAGMAIACLVALVAYIVQGPR
jgi:hypothetical protein